MAENKKILLLKHSVSEEISESEVEDALSRSVNNCLVKALHLNANKIPLTNIDTVNWPLAQQNELSQFLSVVKPALSADSDYTPVYFGMAPIPVALYLGFLISTIKTTTVFQKNHVSHKWEGTVGMPNPTLGAARIEGDLLGLVEASGEAVIRVSTSYLVRREDTASIVPDPLAQLDVVSERIHPDAAQDPGVVEAVAVAFRQALDLIKINRPNVKVVHLFASVPVGLAFKLGAKISPTIHPEVIVYQYKSNWPEKYRPAFPISIPLQISAALSEEDKLQAEAARLIWSEELPKLATWSASLPKSTSWARTIGIGVTGAGDLLAVLPKLQPLASTELPLSSVGRLEGMVIESFRYVPKKRSWYFSESLLHGFRKQFKNDEDLQRAGRLLLLHEAVHLSDHSLTEETSRQIGRFPKLLEAADYEADVWGMMHEFRFARSVLKDTRDHRQLFGDIIENALKGFWAFDDTGRDLMEIPVRRIHRYLNWYWQALALETSPSEEQSFQILSRKPSIELAGPEIRVSAERVFYALNGKYHQPEIAVMHESRVHRFPDGPGSRVSHLLNAFRTRSDEQIRSALNGIFGQVIRQVG